MKHSSYGIHSSCCSRMGFASSSKSSLILVIIASSLSCLSLQNKFRLLSSLIIFGNCQLFDEIQQKVNVWLTLVCIFSAILTRISCISLLFIESVNKFLKNFLYCLSFQTKQGRSLIMYSRDYLLLICKGFMSRMTIAFGCPSFSSISSSFMMFAASGQMILYPSLVRICPETQIPQQVGILLGSCSGRIGFSDSKQNITWSCYLNCFNCCFRFFLSQQLEDLSLEMILGHYFERPQYSLSQNFLILGQSDCICRFATLNRNLFWLSLGVMSTSMLYFLFIALRNSSLEHVLSFCFLLSFKYSFKSVCFPSLISKELSCSLLTSPFEIKLHRVTYSWLN